MIGFLRGKIVAKQPPLLSLDVNGVGYEITCPTNSFSALPTDETETMLFTHFVVREDAQLLYGFTNERDRSLFRTLIKVNGVGPKLAITILSGITADEYVACVQTDDVARLQSIPGIGSKTAKRLIVETRDALKNWKIQNLQLQQQVENADNLNNSAAADAIAALVSLGYKANEARQTVSSIYTPGATSEKVIRLALKEMR